MAAERSSSAGVKSLRAMFENNATAESSLPGKSPGGTLVQNGGERPLSKVRTAFIEVGPPVKMPNGNKAEAGEAQEIEKTQDNSNDAKTEAAAAVPVNQVTKHPAKAASKANPQRSEPISSLGVRSQAPKTAIHSRKESKTKIREVKNQSISSKAGAMSETEKPTTGPSREVLQNLANNLQTPSKEKPKPELSATEQSAPVVKEPENKPIASVASNPQPSMPGKLSNPPKTKTASATAKPRPSTKSPAHPLPARSRPVASSNLTEPKHRAISSTSTAPTYKTTSSGTRSSTGFFKPRPKSPTRPINLPAHLVAQTASSAAKLGTTPTASPVRSRVSYSQPASRRASNISMTSRPSFGPLRKTSAVGPPPKSKVPAKAPEPRTVFKATPDDGFLARMMRPTTSSASKTIHGRVEVSSPPRPKVTAPKVSTPLKASANQSLAVKKRTSGTKAVKQAASTTQKEEVSEPVDSPRQAEYTEYKTQITSLPEEPEIQVEPDKPTIQAAKEDVNHVVEPDVQFVQEKATEPEHADHHEMSAVDSKPEASAESKENLAPEQAEEKSTLSTTPMMVLGSSTRKAYETEASAPMDAFIDLD